MPNGGAKRFTNSGARLAGAQRHAQIPFGELLVPRESIRRNESSFSCTAPSSLITVPKKSREAEALLRLCRRVQHVGNVPSYTYSIPDRMLASVRGHVKKNVMALGLRREMKRRRTVPGRLLEKANADSRCSYPRTPFPSPLTYDGRFACPGIKAPRIRVR